MRPLYVLLTLLPSTVAAQITITPTDFPSNGQKRVDVTASSPDESTFFVTPPGPAQVWDYADFVLTSSDTTQFVDPATTPQGDAFPTATQAVIAPQATLELAGFAGSVNPIYFRAAPDGYYTDGVVVAVPDLADTFVVDFDPDLLIIPAPLNYQDSTNAEARIAVETTLQGNDVLLRSTFQTELIADAWGTLTTPFNTYETLRLRRVESRSDTVFTFFLGQPVPLQTVETGPDTTYTWLVPAGDSGAIGAAMTYTGGSSVGFAVDSAVISTLLVERTTVVSVYPNPVAAGGWVSFTFPHPARALEVRNVLGQTVARRDVSGLSAYRLRTAALAPGVYTYRAGRTVGRFVVR